MDGAKGGIDGKRTLGFFGDDESVLCLDFGNGCKVLVVLISQIN